MPPYIWMPPVCLDNVWMPPIHTQHKESMLCHTKGMSICPHTFGCPLYVWVPLMFRHPICLDATHIFEHPAVCLGDVLMPPVHTQHIESMLPIHLDAPICVDATCMFGCPHVWMAPCMFECPHMFGHPCMFACPPMFGHHPYVWMPSYIWMPCCMFGCPPVCFIAPICVALLATLFSLLQCLDASCMFWCPHMFGHHPCLDAPLYVWTPLVCLDAHMFGWPPVCLNAPICLDTSLYVWMPLVCLDAPICVVAILNFCHFFFFNFKYFIHFSNIPLCWMPPYM